jgi:hypothetical protein
MPNRFKLYRKAGFPCFAQAEYRQVVKPCRIKLANYPGIRRHVGVF